MFMLVDNLRTYIKGNYFELMIYVKLKLIMKDDELKMHLCWEY